MSQLPGINNSEFTITFNKKFWDSEEQWSTTEYVVECNLNKLPRKAKKRFKKKLQILKEFILKHGMYDTLR